MTDVITHEMGHVLGVGTIWDCKSLLKGAGTANPTFGGKLAKKEYRKLLGAGAGLKPVPWRTGGDLARLTRTGGKPYFAMNSCPGCCLSRQSAQSGDRWQPAGHWLQVDLIAAEPFSLPNLVELAEAGLLVGIRADQPGHNASQHSHGVAGR